MDKGSIASAESSSHEQKREYFRIDDEVILHYRVMAGLNLASVEGRLADQTADSFTLGARFAAINHSLRPVMRHIRGESKAIAEYLSAIDKKLNLLAEVALSVNSEIMEQPVQQVNISAGGVLFHAEEALEPGTLLELRMILFPSNTGIFTHAKVSHCCHQRSYSSMKGLPYTMGVEYINITDADRDLIGQHVISKQATNLRSGRSKFRGCPNN